MPTLSPSAAATDDRWLMLELRLLDDEWVDAEFAAIIADAGVTSAAADVVRPDVPRGRSPLDRVALQRPRTGAAPGSRAREDQRVRSPPGD